MKRQIKESYDQIHAPITLINETKQLVHSSETPLQKRTRSHSRKPLYLAASMAACLCILITAGIHFLGNKPQNTAPLTENQVNVGPGVTSESKQFGTVKSAADWKLYVNKVKDSGKDAVTLENAFILYEVPIHLQGTDDTLQIQIKQGKLVKHQDEYSLDGTYECVILNDTTTLGRTILQGLASSRQFTKDAISLKQQDHNHDGAMEFAIEGALSDDVTQDMWYSIGDDYNVARVTN